MRLNRAGVGVNVDLKDLIVFDLCAALGDILIALAQRFMRLVAALVRQFKIDQVILNALSPQRIKRIFINRPFDFATIQLVGFG